MKLSVHFAPPNTLRINELAIVHFLGHLLEREIIQSRFLTDCGIRVGEFAHLVVRFNPISTVRVNEDGIIFLLKQLLEREIQQDPFLAQCGIRIGIEKNGQTITLPPSPSTSSDGQTHIAPTS